ncbi:hypothetical protein PC113_g16455 [Phytophthora cactorum]|uniref:Uncharacterized protein n=1 Tax=Phytophthora cactorum TaxID=29920 RepID=A0A8T0YPB2_9STRA|nr:hypothetical protein PC113_g16455 [Phytophthora cactorum]KAG3161851.1 hypothetical protein PC128_g20718 [Phytophthora cactorum]
MLYCSTLRAAESEKVADDTQSESVEVTEIADPDEVASSEEPQALTKTVSRANAKRTGMASLLGKCRLKV